MTESRIPKHITDNHLKGVEEFKFYGVPATELSRDELLAMVNVLGNELRELRQRYLAIPVAARYSLTD